MNYAVTDNEIIPKLPIESPLPKQREIERRFKRLFGNLSESLTTIIHPIAEETERMLFQLMRPASECIIDTIYVEKRLMGKKSSTCRVRITGYCCPNCQTNEIRHGYEYCPKCGKKIQWKSKY